MKLLKSTISLILTALISFTSVCSSAATIYTWSSSCVHQVDARYGTGMPIRPADGYVSKQNPPDFTWPYVEGATYNLKICTNKNMSNSSLAYSAEGITHNYYNFPHTFETGKDYYWSVQYELGASKSTWSSAKKFRIDVDAYDFPVEDIADILAKISPNHPRIYASDSPHSRYTLEEFRALKDKYTYAANDYASYINTADRYLSDSVTFIEPETPDTDGIANPTNKNVDATVTANCLSVSRNACTRMYNTAFAYLISGNESYGNYAKKILLELSNWRYDDYSATGYVRQDQLFREVMYQGAIAYDWIYPLLTNTERTKVLTMLQNRMKRVESIIPTIKKLPYNSHGWTTIGFMAITAYATIDEISISRGWLEEIIPLYTAAMHPWSNQDGGWAQGLAYWSFSSGFSKELTNILALSGLINLYDKAWSKNEYLWNLYTWGPYTYASFGDGSAGYPNTTDALHAQKDMAHFTGNPVAKWIWTKNNSAKESGLEYFAASLEDLHAEAPTDYKLSHIFEDIGWVVMTNDLMNRDKVQLTFKSSPYGSFNHSHGDQNSFYIQAYGKELAIKSGYYDSYHTIHDKNFTRQSFAHNTTTINGGKGQPIDRFDTSGKVSQFVYQMELDSVTGNSTNAYFDTAASNTKFFDKNERSIVYLRPGVFVVIDTLDARSTKESTYEWWLNAVDIENSGNMATITNGSVKLDAQVMYPEGVTSQKYEGFVTPDGTEYLPNGFNPNTVVHNRVSFSTPSLAKTKMVVVMDVYDENNEETVNINPVATISSDKKYMLLDFGDSSGSKAIIKLTDDDEPVVCGNIEFVGDAVTYTNNSIMLTNGYYLKYDGKTLVDAESQKVTVCMGCDQLGISSENDAVIQIGNFSKFWSISDINAVTDEKGRNVSENNLGVNLSLEEDILFTEIEKGSYTLLKNLDTAISTYQIAPGNIYIKKDEKGNPKVYWDTLRYADYDISINDKVTEDVNSGYALPKDETTCKIMLRSKLSMAKSDWSAPVYYSEDSGEYVSYVRYEESGDNVTASRYVRAGQESGFYTAVYGNNGLLGVPAIDVKTEGVFTNTVTKTDGTGEIRSYIWTNSLAPQASKGTYKSDSTDLKGIYVDGKLIDGFESAKETYTIDLSSRKENYYPVISATAVDSSAKVSILNADTATNKATINIEAGSGAKREVTVNIIPKSDMHIVQGSSEEADFVKDGGRENASSKVSVNNVATISYVNSEDTLVVKNLKLYTNFNDREDGYFGARVSNDRDPNSVNHMEMYYVDDAIKGYDYFVFGNDNVYRNDKGKQTYTVEFTLDADEAEVIVLGNNFDGLLSDGFTQEDKLWAKGRYMHVVGNEDVFYNVTYRGKSLDDCVYNSGQKKYYMKNYDVMREWVDVTAPEIGASWSVDDYFKNADSLSKSMFPQVNNNLMSYTVDWNNMFVSAYTKRFTSEGSSLNVSFDLTNLNQSTRAVVLVRPIATKNAVSDFEFLAPTSFGEVPSKLKRGYTGDADFFESIDYYGDFEIINGFGNGAKAFANTHEVISNFNDLCEIENAFYIPPHKSTGLGDAWFEAYYHGIGEISDANGSYSFPCIRDKAFDLYRFKLNCSGNIYVASNGEKPGFIDDSWTKLNVGEKVFSAGGEDYTDLYTKYIDVSDKESVSVTMQTKGSAQGNYYVFIKPAK